AVMTEAGRLSDEVLAPLNWSGDREGASLKDGVVTTPSGFNEAYQKFAEGGWAGLSYDPEYGGQGLPQTLSTAVMECWQAANLSFGLSPTLTLGAIEALEAHGSEDQKQTFLPKLNAGTWTGTMNLTESHAGSDVGALRSKAVPNGDGTFSITGTKIYITYGEHDMAENIVHLVLARLPDAPIGTRGISLFLVPKYHVNADGSLGERNDVQCVGLEEKLGIHGSPTCVMAFGEKGGATGTLIGRENKGMACMFTMMNNARLAVGVQGLAMGERAYQKAHAFALERKQGKLFGLQHQSADMVPIIQHPDVRRMLLDMRAKVEAARAICLANAFAIDEARTAANDEDKRRAKLREELLIPLSKAWSTDIGCEVASTGIQVHGGMGYVEETGAAQFLRDARITPIYEGTNGIQAIDLVTRKLPMEGGEAVQSFIREMRMTAGELQRHDVHGLKEMGVLLARNLESVEATTQFLLEKIGSAPTEALSGATPYLDQLGTIAGAHYLGLGAIAAAKQIEASPDASQFYRSRLVTARYFFDSVLPRVEGLVSAITTGRSTFLDLEVDLLAL
ncbi:MAG: acyl-CoA dehydrogenase, partial [Pseudomonadota bacterium]